MPNHADKKGDEDNGQNHPQSDVGVQQKLRFGHSVWRTTRDTREPNRGSTSGCDSGYSNWLINPIY